MSRPKARPSFPFADTKRILLTVHILSPQNEAHLVKELECEIRRVWPEAANGPEDRIDLLVGARSGFDVDLLIVLDLVTPRAIPSARRSDTPVARLIKSGLIAVEIKQLDATRFERTGNQLFPIYYGKRSDRSCSDQARDAAYAIKNLARESGFPNLYVHALAWLTQLDPSALDGIDPAIVAKTDWGGILTAACNQNSWLCHADEATRAGVRAVRDRLLLRRTLTPLDIRKSERIARDSLVRELVAELSPHAGNALIRLTGHGGSGKTTALILLATRLATHDNARVLVLTFHHALSGDIRHVFKSVPEAQGLLGDRIHVETAMSFLLGLVAAAGGSVPQHADSKIDYDRVDATFREVATALKPSAGERGDNGEAVIDEDRERFAWDHVLIDEAQDWSDAERDLLMSVYGSRRLVLADGLVQLIRRQTSCNWTLGVPKAERIARTLGDSLRMQHNVALFANEFARTLGFTNWNVAPRAELLGGRIVILEGELDDAPALVRALGTAAALGKASPVDNVICVPHSEIAMNASGGRGARLAADLQAEGETVWDACNPLTRTSAPEGSDAWRIVQYDSCRGLEGWATLLLRLDDLYTNRMKHPNIGSAETIDPEVVARRWLLIPLTRAVHLLVVHVRDPQSAVATMLREATASLPKGFVETYAANDGAARLAAVAAAKSYVRAERSI